LCEQIKVSRTPLREALKLLEVEGLIEISQNRGARIMSFTQTEAQNLFEVIAREPRCGVRRYTHQRHRSRRAG
jgi:DNA-binding GntR family transcriptional regulator